MADRQIGVYKQLNMELARQEVALVEVGGIIEILQGNRISRLEIVRHDFHPIILTIRQVDRDCHFSLSPVFSAHRARRRTSWRGHSFTVRRPLGGNARSTASSNSPGKNGV